MISPQHRPKVSKALNQSWCYKRHLELVVGLIDSEAYWCAGTRHGRPPEYTLRRKLKPYITCIEQLVELQITMHLYSSVFFWFFNWTYPSRIIRSKYGKRPGPPSQRLSPAWARDPMNERWISDPPTSLVFLERVWQPFLRIPPRNLSLSGVAFTHAAHWHKKPYVSSSFRRSSTGKPLLQ